MSDELREAAESLIAYYEQTENPRILDGQAVPQSIMIARRVLAMFPADDGEPVTWEWLGEPNATESRHLELVGWEERLTIYIGISNERTGFCAVVNGSPYMHAIRLNNRGTLRVLCTALGIPLKESVQP